MSNKFLTAVGELVFPTGFEQAATTAGLFAVDRLSQRRNQKKSQKGGMDMDMNTTTMPPTSMPPQEETHHSDLSGGARKRTTRRPAKKASRSSGKKTARKSGKKSARKGKKGGNAFLTAAGELLAPTGWPNLVTTAALGTAARLTRSKKSKK